MQTIVVIDYGMGNLHSVSKALEHVAGDARVLVSSRKEEILSADRVVFPGVGAIRDCMAEIRRLGFDALIPELVTSRPMLAICVGMQALMAHSDENGGVECLAQFDGQVRGFDDQPAIVADHGLKVPHMGWNQVTQQMAHPLWRGIANDSRFYFVHSYFVEGVSSQLVAANTVYGMPFVSAVARERVFAVQFHPEKSQRDGLQLLRNFVHWDGTC